MLPQDGFQLGLLCRPDLEITSWRHEDLIGHSCTLPNEPKLNKTVARKGLAIRLDRCKQHALCPVRTRVQFTVLHPDEKSSSLGQQSVTQVAHQWPEGRRVHINLGVGWKLGAPRLLQGIASREDRCLRPC